MARANPRAICVQTLNRWESEKKYADELIHESLASCDLATLDRAFLTETFYGVIRNLSRLDYIVSQLRDTPVDHSTRQVLRLGFYQIFNMRIPHHAAVNETVNLAGKARGLVNALLRRAIREFEELQEKLDETPPAVRFSHPEFLIRRWEEHFGPDAAMQICRWNNSPAEVYARANGLKVTTGELLATAHDAEVSCAHPLSIKVRQVPYPWIINGLCYVQDPSTLLACDLLAPKPGERVLDACAAPGGKATYLAQLMGNTGEIVACDLPQQRLKRLEENVKRLGATCVKVSQCNWLTPPAPFEPGSFDRILVDAPCSNTGVIRRRVDARWRLTPEDFPRMHEKQVAIMKAVAPLLKKGGALVYSTCSLEPEENEHMAKRIEAEIPGLRFLESRETLPFRDHVDGAFAAKFEKAA
ncbi:MAG TPA: 16S rRNA (cytosine(967)-C(5))-methyltransferase RsmB [Chthoniobacteraceae bacterium]|nr:16S rRNA (cytosine(967)-C(5))-methyltransferase RsmB [Chthoniobacteraceae bacterium]